MFIVSKVGLCAFMADEAKSHYSEQLAICIRYLVGLSIKKSFVSFEDCSQFGDAKSLYNLIIKFLNTNNLERFSIIAQSYDGANVMSGCCKGVQTLITEKYSQAMFIHCMSHRLNLLLVSECKANNYCIMFFLIF